MPASCWSARGKSLLKKVSCTCDHQAYSNQARSLGGVHHCHFRRHQCSFAQSKLGAPEKAILTARLWAMPVTDACKAEAPFVKLDWAVLCKLGTTSGCAVHQIDQDEEVFRNDRPRPNVGPLEAHLIAQGWRKFDSVQVGDARRPNSFPAQQHWWAICFRALPSPCRPHKLLPKCKFSRITVSRLKQTGLTLQCASHRSARQEAQPAAAHLPALAARTS